MLTTRDHDEEVPRGGDGEKVAIPAHALHPSVGRWAIQGSPSASDCRRVRVSYSHMTHFSLALRISSGNTSSRFCDLPQMAGCQQRIKQIAYGWELGCDAAKQLTMGAALSKIDDGVINAIKSNLLLLLN